MNQINLVAFLNRIGRIFAFFRLRFGPLEVETRLSVNSEQQ